MNAWVQRRRCRASTCGEDHQLQPVVQPQLRRRPAGRAATSTRTGGAEPLAHRLRRERQPDELRRPSHPRRPGRPRQPERGRLVLLQHRHRPPDQFHWAQQLLGGDCPGMLGVAAPTPGHVAVPTASAMSTEAGLRFSPQHRRRAMGDNLDDATRHALRAGPAAADAPSAMTLRLSYTLTPNLSLQLYGSRSSSAGHYENYKELVDGRAERYADRYAPYAYNGQRRLQLPLVPHHQRAALGIQAGLGAVRGVEPGPRGADQGEGSSISAATSAAVHTPAQQRVPGEVQQVVQFLTLEAARG